MKKIIATALCLTLATPCFAAERYYNYYPTPHHNNAPYYHYDSRYNHHNGFHNRKKCHRTSHRTKTIGAIAGVAGIALLISAIAD